jgi:hypothetical protein
MITNTTLAVWSPELYPTAIRGSGTEELEEGAEHEDERGGPAEHRERDGAPPRTPVAATSHSAQGGRSCN